KTQRCRADLLPIVSIVEGSSAISSRKRAAPTFARNRIIPFQVRSNLAVRNTRHSGSSASLASRRAAWAELRRSSVRLLVLRRVAGDFSFKLYAPVRWAIGGPRCSESGVRKVRLSHWLCGLEVPRGLQIAPRIVNRRAIRLNVLLRT